MPLEYKVKCAMLKGYSINVKSPALATGAVIVDLPGVHDANAARAAVAEGYSKFFPITFCWVYSGVPLETICLRDRSSHSKFMLICQY